MTFVPGQSGNPNGRKAGTRNKRTQEILDLLQNRGDKDPLDFLSEVVTGPNHYTPELKVQASNILAPYLHSKRATLPAPRYFPEPVQVPNFTTVEDAEAYLARLPVMLGAGEIDSQSALELSTLVSNWITAKRQHRELELKISAQGDQPDQTTPVQPFRTRFKALDATP